MPMMAVVSVIIIIRPVLLVSRADINAEPFICFGLGWCDSKEPECCQSHEEKSFHMRPFPVLDEDGTAFDGPPTVESDFT